MTDKPFNSLNDYYNALLDLVESEKLKFSEFQEKLSQMGSKKRDREFENFMKRSLTEFDNLQKQKPTEKRLLFSVNGKLCFREDEKWVEIPKRFQEKTLNNPELYFFGEPIPSKFCDNCQRIFPIKLFSYRKYCSEQCQTEAKLKRKRKKYRNDHPLKVRVCRVCNKIIEGRSDKQVCGNSSCQKAYYRKYGRTRKKER